MMKGKLNNIHLIYFTSSALHGSMQITTKYDKPPILLCYTFFPFLKQLINRSIIN